MPSERWCGQRHGPRRGFAESLPGFVEACPPAVATVPVVLNPPGNCVRGSVGCSQCGELRGQGRTCWPVLWQLAGRPDSDHVFVRRQHPGSPLRRFSHPGPFLGPCARVARACRAGVGCAVAGVVLGAWPRGHHDHPGGTHVRRPPPSREFATAWQRPARRLASFSHAASRPAGLVRGVPGSRTHASRSNGSVLPAGSLPGAPPDRGAKRDQRPPGQVFAQSPRQHLPAQSAGDSTPERSAVAKYVVCFSRHRERQARLRLAACKWRSPVRRSWARRCIGGTTEGDVLKGGSQRGTATLIAAAECAAQVWGGQGGGSVGRGNCDGPMICLKEAPLIGAVHPCKAPTRTLGLATLILAPVRLPCHG